MPVLQPPPRAQFGMTADTTGGLYVYGGRGMNNQTLGDFWHWHATTNRWQRLSSADIPALIEPHLAADGAGNIYEFGGIGSPTGSHFSADGHSYGLYQYLPTLNRWLDRTPAAPHLGTDWPLGREDHGFTYDPATASFWLFAGEGPELRVLNDMWRYTPATQSWQRIQPNYAAPGDAQIAPREIYAISDDGHGHFYLFGGADLDTIHGQPVAPRYANDLWRFDIAAQRWTLLAGHANSYDPSLPLPRHYYGQACDATGNFYILGGVVSDTTDPPYFNADLYNLYAQLIIYSGQTAATGFFQYGLDDFWRYDPVRDRWIDLTDQLGDLSANPFIPFVMIAEPRPAALLTFGGYHPADDDTMALSSGLWRYPLPSAARVAT